MRTLPFLLLTLIAAFGATAPAVAGLRAADQRQQGMTGVLARAAARSAQWDSAARLWRDVTLAQPDDAGAWAALGEALARTGRPADAIAALARAAELDPLLPGIAPNLGRAQLQQGNAAAAAAAFGAATSATPKDPGAWTGLGIARDLMGDHPAAQQAYARALALDPLHRAARHNHALSLRMQAAGMAGGSE